MAPGHLSVTHKNMTYFMIKLRFVGICQADRAGLEKAPRWAKILSKSFQTKTCLDFVGIFKLQAPKFDNCHHYGEAGMGQTRHVFASPDELSLRTKANVTQTELMGGSGGVVNSLYFCPASLKSLGCFYFRCVLSSQWKTQTPSTGLRHPSFNHCRI